ncbi:phosphatidylserine decarboxylase-domain-containing protein [Phellopilus nigrolimitatus]|nr:phosphatidylserine decarboxylase-domain-containing protein [Phellopilus nigrolimitatus]
MANDPHAALVRRHSPAAVQNSDDQRHDVTKGIHAHGDANPAAESAHAHTSKRHAWLEHLVPGIERITVKYHAGNFVALRDPTKPPGSTTMFESMPIYARIGMHLLFYGKEQRKLLEGGKLENMLREQSLKQGAIYDSPESAHSIPSFVETYKINTAELLEPDLSKYRTFNEFFYRKLKPGARPVQNTDPNAFCSAADSRLTVYQTIEEAQKFWIKGDEFNLSTLLHGPSTSHTHHTTEAPEATPPFTIEPAGASLALFRLAPADYHRFHSPVSGTILHGPVDVPGTYYTVNPQAVTEVDFDVFTANRRSVLYIREDTTAKLVAFVAIGALLVGGIGWSKAKGDRVERAEELGWFAYGGSTVVVVFSDNIIKFDEDLRANSEKSLETYLKVGESLGVVP